MSNEASKYLNLLFNPFEYENLPKSKGETPFETGVKHAVGLTAGYGSIGMLMRYLHKMKTEASVTKNDKKMRSYINAKHPILSLDNSTRDLKTEQKEKGTGVRTVDEIPGLNKQADLRKAVSGLWGGMNEGTSRLMSTNKDSLHPALALAAVLGGGGLGWSLAGNKITKDTNKELDNNIDENENAVDKLLYEEYIKTRGLDKFAATDQEVYNRHSGQVPASATGNILEALKDPTKLSAGAASAYSIAALGLTYLAYKTSKGYTDSIDEDRSRMKQLKNILSEKGKVRNAPKFYDMTSFPDKGSAVPKSNSVTIQRKSENTNPSKDTSVDQDDPYANLLRS